MLTPAPPRSGSRSWARFARLATMGLLLALSRPLQAQLPVSGRPVPALAYLDTIILDFMSDPGRSISAGVLGVSRGGRVVFLHAYGELTPGQPLPETALFRLASVTKPITAAAIHRWAQTNGFGATQLQRRAFNLAGNGGVLNVNPAGPPDANLPAITLGHLLAHSAGWDRNVVSPGDTLTSPGDIPITRVRNAGIAMNEPDALPTRAQLIDWALQFPLNFAPGAALYNAPGGVLVTPGPGTTYSNFGYLILGEVLQASAPGGYLGYLASDILSAANWVPTTDWGPANSLQAARHPREPEYVSAEGPYPSIFDYSAKPEVLPAQYGGRYHLETMLAHGGLIASAQAMLRFGTLFSVTYTNRGVGPTLSNDIGLPLPAAGIPDNLDSMHTGRLPGTSTSLRQRGLTSGAADDEVIFVAFNECHEPPAGTTVQDWAQLASDRVVAYLNLITAAGTWPSERCDGFWVRLGEEIASAGHGGYQATFRGFQSALNRAGDGSDLRLLPGRQNWRGTVSKRLRLDAPEGPVVLGR